MNKVIAIVDMPEICYDCPCYKDNYNRRCALNNRNIKKEIDKNPYTNIQTWCPLKEVPNEEKRSDIMDEYEDGWADGFNYLRSVILNEVDYKVNK